LIVSDLRLSQHFHRYFESVLVKDDADRSEVFRLRYAVYCKELAYEDASAFPEGEERDEFDAHASFVLIRHRSDGRSAGCLRLVGPRHGVAEWRFPFEHACAGHLDRRFVPELERNRDGICEVSRLAVHSDFRRRKGELASASGGDAEGAARSTSDRQYPLIAMGLFLSASALFLNGRMQQVWVMMEPRLARLLSGCGLRFTQVGDVIDYHGRRGPFRISREEVLLNLRSEARELLEDLMRTLR
jgi:N-acyl amino acid synthase of PEP-CTERM/exosortase system